MLTDNHITYMPCGCAGCQAKSRARAAAPAPMTATSGASSPASFAALGPGGCWLKTCQGFSRLRLDGTSEEFSGTWPSSGTMRSGKCFPLPAAELHTSGAASSWLPTPTATPYGNNQSPSPGAAVRLSLQAMASRNLWPTPRASDGEKSAGGHPGRARPDTLPSAVKMWPAANTRGVDGGSNSRKAAAARGEKMPTSGGALNPRWVEWLMGFPDGWTDLGGSATPSCPSSPSTSAG